MDVHHIYWMRKWYRGTLERKFRELYTITICRLMHDELHAVTQPPPKPSREHMEQAISIHRSK